MRGKLRGIRYIVPMRQENMRYAAERFQPPHELWQELGRIDQPVARRVSNEITASAVRLERREAAIKNGPLDRQRKIGHHRFGVVRSPRSDRTGGARHQRLQSRPLVAGSWLALHKRVFVGLAKNPRRK